MLLDVGACAMLAEPQNDTVLFESLLWLGGLVLAALLSGLVLVYVKKRSRAAERDQGADFTLDDLRRLRDRGDLTDTEYDVLRRRAIEQHGVSTGAHG